MCAELFVYSVCHALLRQVVFCKKMTGRNIGICQVCRLVCRIRHVGIILRLYRADLALLGFANPYASVRNQSTMLGFASFKDCVGICGIGNVGICDLLGGFVSFQVSMRNWQ